MSLKNVDNFHRMKHLIGGWVRKTIQGPNEVIHGARSVNAQVGSQHLKTQTRDYDVFSNKPRQSALQTERFIDKRMGFNAMQTKKGKSQGTYRVKSIATGKTYADYTKPQKKVPSVVINGKRYSTLDYEKAHAQQVIKNQSATHRLQQDIDKLNRIKLNKRQNIKW